MDKNDRARLLTSLALRGIDDIITEELACSRPTKGTTGASLIAEFKQGLASLNVAATELSNITPDEAPNTVRTNHGFVGVFNKEYPTYDMVFLHYSIHQDVLCKATLNMRHVLDVALKLLNTIYARGLYHTQFQDILQPVDDEYSDVRWLSVGNVFECLIAEKGNRVFPCFGRK